MMIKLESRYGGPLYLDPFNIVAVYPSTFPRDYMHGAAGVYTCVCVRCCVEGTGVSRYYVADTPERVVALIPEEDP